MRLVCLIFDTFLFIFLFCFSGGFAFVYEAQDLGSGKDYALKVMTVNTPTLTETAAVSPIHSRLTL